LLWFPKLEQVFQETNPSYVRSLFIGITAPVLLLPRMLWNHIIDPLVYGIFTFIICMVRTVILGFMGELTGRPMTKQEQVEYETGMIDDK